MRKLIFAAVFAITLFVVAPLRADHRDSDRMWDHSRFRYNQQVGTPGASASDPTPVPEPSSVLMLASGLLTLGGLGLIRRNL